MARAPLWLSLLVLALLGACAAETTLVPSTQLIVRVGADSALRQTLGSLRVRTAAPENGRWTQQQARTYAAATLHWPVDFVLVPTDESKSDDTFEVIIEALDAQGVTLAQSRVLTSYVLRQAHILPLQLASCGGSPGGVCEANPECLGPGCQTCLAAGCANTPVIEAADLPRSDLDEGDEPRTDAAIQGIDAVDAGAHDSGIQRADAGAQGPLSDGGSTATPGDAGSQGPRGDGGSQVGPAAEAGGPASDPCANACDPLASCNASSGKPVCSCPSTHTTSNGGKTCVVRDADAGLDGGNVDPDASAPSSTKLPRVTNTDAVGPFASVTTLQSAGPGGWLVYPAELGKGGVKHPLFVFGVGGGSTPQQYQQHLERWASYGFVIYSPSAASTSGNELRAGVDWLIQQNSVSSSPLYQKLDVSKVAAAGHSSSSLGVYAFLPDARVTTTIHISGGSFDGMGPAKLSKPAMFLCGPSMNEDVAVPQCDTDFANSRVPTFYAKLQGGTHLTTARLGWPAIIAWLLWHLADQEDVWKKQFVETSGIFRSGIYVSQSKNWP